MPSTLQRKKRKYPNSRCKHKRIGSYTMAETEGRKPKTDWIRKQIFIGHGKEIRHKRTGTTGSSVGTETF